MIRLPSTPYDRAHAAAPAAVVRCQLLPNPWLLRNGLGVLVPWFGALALALVASSVLGRLFDTLQGQYVGLAVIVPIVVGALVLTVRRSLKRHPVSELEIDPYELSVRDLKTGTITFRAPRSTLACRRGSRRYNQGRGGGFEHAVLFIETPGQKPLSIGATDARFRWADSSAEVGAPRYVLGADDWSALAQALGLFGVLRGAA